MTYEEFVGYMIGLGLGLAAALVAVKVIINLIRRD